MTGMRVELPPIGVKVLSRDGTMSRRATEEEAERVLAAVVQALRGAAGISHVEARVCMYGTITFLFDGLSDDEERIVEHFQASIPDGMPDRSS